MDTITIRDQLHQYLELADDRKLKAIYVMLEDAIKESKVEYTEEDKAELDRRVRNVFIYHKPDIKIIFL